MIERLEIKLKYDLYDRNQNHSLPLFLIYILHAIKITLKKLNSIGTSIKVFIYILVM